MIVNYNQIFNITFRTCGIDKIDFNFKYTSEIKNFGNIFNKPSNKSCLWASPAEDQGNFYTWSDFCRSSDWKTSEVDKFADFRIKGGAKVLLIQNNVDVMQLPWNDEGLVDFNKLFSWYDVVFVNYSELSHYDEDYVEIFLDTYDCDTLMVRNLSAIYTERKTQYIYLTPENWAKKNTAKAAHEGCFCKGIYKGEEVVFFFAHGNYNGLLEFKPGQYTDHEYIARSLEMKASQGKFSERFYENAQRRKNSSFYNRKEFKEKLITHGCYDNSRADYESENFVIKSATNFGCTYTRNDGESKKYRGYLKIAICEC